MGGWSEPTRWPSRSPGWTPGTATIWTPSPTGWTTPPRPAGCGPGRRDPAQHHRRGGPSTPATAVPGRHDGALEARGRGMRIDVGGLRQRLALTGYAGLHVLLAVPALLLFVLT